MTVPIFVCLFKGGKEKPNNFCFDAIHHGELKSGLQKQSLACSVRTGQSLAINLRSQASFSRPNKLQLAKPD